MTLPAEPRPAPEHALPPTTGTLAVSVHGERGVLDLLVPDGATPPDVLQEYARQTGSSPAARLFDGRGHELPTDLALADGGVRSGGVLVTARALPGRADRDGRSVRAPGTRVPPTLVALLAAAGVLALLAAVLAGATGEGQRERVVAVLGVGALLGVLPLGARAGRRVVAAPALGAALGLVAAWDTDPARLPMVVGIAGAAAAVTAAVGSALAEEGRAALRVWMWAGGAVFVVAGAAAVLGLDERVVWSVLLVGGMLAGRVVPSLAVDVPDQTLVDIDRLAVSAWSARERRTGGRRSRAVVGRESVEEVVARGSQVVTAAAAAVLVVTLVSAPLVLLTTTLPLDEVGAPLLVALVGATQLLVARSYRHGAARALLRTAGLWALGCVLVLVVAQQDWRAQVGIAAIVLGALLVPVAVAVGRGWRSAWWSRRAEVAEAVAVAFSVPALAVTVGLFRRIWEIVG